MLNPEQQAAVSYTDGPLLVLAGAGSGKTRVITQKIAHLLQTVDYRPHQVFAVTFTNKAAKEMQARVAKATRAISTKGLTVTTFHRLGLRIIRQHAAALKLSSRFSILDQADARDLLRQLLHSDNETISDINSVQMQLAQLKNAMLTPAQAIAQAATGGEQQLARIYLAYTQALRAYNAVDFDDLLLLPVQLLQADTAVLEHWQNTIRYLLVDEYQDTNGAQYTLLKLLVGVRGQFTVVGDDDQSIYAWRGAQADNLVKLQEDFPRLKVIKLEQNYRSTQRILQSANALINHNAHLFSKKLWSSLGVGDKIRIILCKTSEAEAQRVVNEIVSHRLRTGKAYHHYAVLYRNNHQARPLEQALREQQIPYRLSGGQSFFSHTEVKDILAYCRLAANPEDDSAFLRIVNVPRRGIGPQTIEKLSHYAKQRNSPLLAACEELGLSQYLAPNAMKHLQQFVSWFKRIAQQLVGDNSAVSLKQLLTDIDYDSWLAEHYDNPAALERRQKNVTELIAWIERLLQGDESLDFSATIQRLCLIDMLAHNDETVTDQVQLMTLHAAKGLEFPYVFLIGVEEELLPHRNNLEGENLAEERRLAYVGITRAQQQLVLTLTSQRRRQKEFYSPTPSRFLAELPEEHIQWEGHNIQRDPIEQKQSAKTHLQSLKDLLAQA